MNSRPIGILFLGMVLFALTGLFPPVNRVQTVKVINQTSGSEEVQEVNSAFHGYQFYFSLDDAKEGEEFRVAKIILVGEWLLLLILIRILVVAYRDKKSKLPQQKIFHQP